MNPKAKQRHLSMRGRIGKSGVILLMPFALLFGGCEEASPLSNTEIADPSLLRPQFTVKKTKDERDGSSVYTFEAEILDRKGRYLTLLNGSVYLNGIKMFTQQRLFEEVSTYRLYTDAIKFRLDSLYTFVVVLSDGQEYATSVRTPATDMFSSTASLRNDTAFFTWEGNNTDSTEFYYAMQSNDGVAPWYTRAIDPKGKNDASFPTVWSYQSVASGYRISTFRRNPVHPAFGGGWIRATISLSSD